MRLLAYTRKGKRQFAAVQNAMHLALEQDGAFVPLKNNTGILYPEASFKKDAGKGKTKTLLRPWLYRRADGTFGIACILTGENERDEESLGSIAFYSSPDLVSYAFKGLLFVGGSPTCAHCRYDETTKQYRLEWLSKGKYYCMETPEECTPTEIRRIAAFSETPPRAECKDAIVGSAIDITEAEAEVLKTHFARIRHVANAPMEISVKAGEAYELPKATLYYSDGSAHEKPVVWDALPETKKKGVYYAEGTIRQPHYPFPFFAEHVSDPCLRYYRNRYYFCCTGMRNVRFKVAERIEDLPQAEDKIVWKLPESDKTHYNIWAQELHIIRGVPYVFTTVGHKQWYTVRSHILRCKGDIENPDDWEEPRLVVRKDGTELNPDGISLDMTYFEAAGKHYVMWSDRVIRRKGGRICPDSANLLLAEIDPGAPWQLTSDPVCIYKPLYGWDRLDTEVAEGPFLLRRGKRLYITYSGSSTAKADLYCLGLLWAEEGDNLLDPSVWKTLPYPVLNKESVAGQFGPGHNTFIKDTETGDDILVFHAVPHDKRGKSLGRKMALRRVHWGKNGFPYFEMTEEEDVAPDLRRVKCKIIVE